MLNTYTVLDSGKKIAENLKGSEVAKIINTNVNSLSHYAKSGKLYNNRYLIIKDGEVKEIYYKRADLIDPVFKTDWNNMRRAAELIKNGQGKIVTKTINGKLVKYTVAI